jgi:hypothetical protein
VEKPKLRKRSKIHQGVFDENGFAEVDIDTLKMIKLLSSYLKAA